MLRAVIWTKHFRTTGEDRMGGQDLVKFHADRAMEELDLALRASSEAAAQAHFRLSSLHLDRMRSLSAVPEAAVEA